MLVAAQLSVLGSYPPATVKREAININSAPNDHFAAVETAVLALRAAGALVC